MMQKHLDDAALNALLDDELPPAERVRAEAHLDRCAECAADAAALRALHADLAALPRGIAPGRDLLPEIHARIDAAGIVPLRPDAARPWSPRTRAPLGQRTLFAARRELVAAAAALVLASSALTALLLGRTGDDATLAPPTALAPAAVSGMEARFVSATRELERVLDIQREGLSPETVRILDENLAIIDAALAEARAALDADPGNAALSEILMATYEKKLDLLRRAATSVTT
jgi:anti-sigma factor RsiW